MREMERKGTLFTVVYPLECGLYAVHTSYSPWQRQTSMFN